jgi:glycosyltransferase involved in cell wall biosynthesis
MGIKNEFLATNREIENFALNLAIRKNSKIKIGYVGHFAPGDYSKGIKDLIDLALINSHSNNDFSVTLIGALGKEKAQLEANCEKMGVDTNYINIKPHIKHSEVSKTLKNFDVLILPEYESNLYNGMPLKLLEYLASGRVTLVADTPLYRSLFNSTFLPFFYTPRDSVSLYQNISSALNCENLVERLIQGVDFAREYTWGKRVDRILDNNFLESIIV